jgi:hypothetical protein
MTAIGATNFPAVHTGQCRSPRMGMERPDRGYCVHDSNGRPVGTITAPERRPILGRSAPTYYLRRD